MDGEGEAGEVEQKMRLPELLQTGFLSNRHGDVCLEGENEK